MKIKNKISVFLFLVLMFSMISSCNQNINKSVEAQKEAEKFWENFITKCGDSYYLRSYNGSESDSDKYSIYEFKRFIVYAKEGIEPSKQLTEAEKLNQGQEGKLDNKSEIQWEGKIVLLPTANRYYTYKTKEWSKWQDELPSIITLFNPVKFMKIDGQWTSGKYPGTKLDENYFQVLQRMSPKIDCSEIPK